MKFRTLAVGFGLAAAFSALPTTAYSVAVSSGSGFGSQNASHWYSDGADVTGTLTSVSGDPVYYQGSVAYSLNIDYKVGRYTSNTSSTSAVTRGGTVRKGSGGLQGVRVKVCHDIGWSPDTCGGYSLISYP
jgi:hypothetical protein